MLTFVSFIDDSDAYPPDLLVLNADRFFPSSLSVMDTYRYKHLFLENERVNDRYTRAALARNSGYLDHRGLYKGYKGLNDWTCHIGKAPMSMIDPSAG
jgi:hypothetical protein